MEKLFEIFARRMKYMTSPFHRYLMKEINWDDRLIAILGARGTGKTTLILQYIKENFKINEEVLYISLDDIFFTENRLSDIANTFVNNGGKFLFIDEVHKYTNWNCDG